MSGDVIKEFLVSLGFKVDEAGMAKFSQGIASASLRITALATTATAAAGGIVMGVQKIAEEFYQLDKIATQFRTTADAIDEFSDAAVILGIKEETSIDSLKNLDRAIVDTSMGLGRAKLVFEDLGISVEDAAGKLKPTTEVMAELAEKFKTMERGKQIRVMERLDLDPSLLKLFSADMAALRAEMNAIDNATGFDLGKSIAESKDFMSVWRLMTQEIQKWKMLFSKMMEAIAVKLMPKLSAQIKAVTGKMLAFRQRVMGAMPKIINAVSPIIDIVLRIAEAFIIVAGRVASGISSVLGWLSKVNDMTNGWAGYILAAAAAWEHLNLAFLKTPLGILLSLAAAIALLVDDFMTWREGGKSLINWGEWKNEIDLATDLIDGLKAVLVDAFQAIFAAIDAVVSLLTGGWSSAWTAVKSMIGSIGGMFSGGSNSARGLSVTPQSAAAMTSGGQNVNQQTQIVVQGSGDPAATARAVSGQQNRVNADMTRNMRGAAR